MNANSKDSGAIGMAATAPMPGPGGSSLAAASLGDFWHGIKVRAQTMRDEAAGRCEDMALSDGTVMFSKEQWMETIAAYDELIDAINRRA